MTRITHSDQALALLRAELRRLQRARGAGAGAKQKTPVSNADATPSTAPASAREGSQDPAASLIEALLLEEWGPELSASPSFQNLVAGVVAALKRDPDASDLLRLVTSAKTPGGAERA